MNDPYKVPVLGFVGEDGKVELTPKGEQLLMGLPDNGDRIDLAKEAGQAAADEVSGLDDVAARCDEYADAMMSAVHTLDGIAELCHSYTQYAIQLAANEMRGAAIRLYGVARELRRD